MPTRLTTEVFVERARAVHGNKYDYSKVEYRAKDVPVCIICPTHGEFFQTPNNHWKGKGCQKCKPNAPLSATDFLLKARSVHGDKYDYSGTEFVRTADKIAIRCPVHGVFYQTANSHLAGHGCPECVDRVLSDDAYVMRQEKTRASCLSRYGVDNPMRVRGIVLKNEAVKRLHGTFNTSVLESRLYERLVQFFGEDDVVQQYRSDLYPWRCDFYVVSRALYIEGNFSWTHGGHFYDSESVQDREKVQIWLNRAQLDGRAYYAKAVDTWTDRDVRKLHMALAHHLNYVVFWNPKFSDVDAWFAQGCPNLFGFDVPLA